MSHRTAEEALEQYQLAMGSELGTAFHRLVGETYHLTSIWDQYETLFKNKERVDLLNGSGGYFFRNVQDIFFERVLLGLCRLTDPAEQRGRRNLSLSTLVPLVSEDLRAELIQAIAEAKQASGFCRDWRNRLIAHNDFERALKTGKPLKAATGLGVVAALKAVHSVLRLLGLKYLDTHMVFSGIDDAGVHLLHQLYWGRERMNDRKKRLAERIYLDEDFSTPSWLDRENTLSRYD